jgi:hypothetical protein
MIRVNHYGADATAGVVVASLVALGAALPGSDVAAAEAAARDAWAAAGF